MASKILVVEDDRDYLQFLQFVLEEGGYLPLLASSAKTGLRWLDEPGARPELILLDIGLPDMDGLELCRALKSNPATSRLPVAVLTGRMENSQRIRAATAQADIVLHKPIEAQDLLKALRSLLEAPRETRRGLLHRAGFEIDPVKRTLFFNGRSVADLGAHLFDLLYVLIDRWPHPASPRQILSSLGLQTRDDEVYAMVSRLRGRLREEFGLDLIATVPSQGYRFEPPVAHPAREPGPGARHSR